MTVTKVEQRRRWVGYRAAPEGQRVFHSALGAADDRRMSLTGEVPTRLRADLCRELRQQLRTDAIRATAASGSGHSTLGDVVDLIGSRQRMRAA